MNKYALGIVAALVLTVAAAHAQASTLSGKIVDLATYVTHDHNMDAMKMSHSTSDIAMKGDAMHAESTAVTNCPASLGLVTSSGRVYLLATQMGSTKAQALCTQMGKTASISGTVFSQGGMTALLVK